MKENHVENTEQSEGFTVLEVMVAMGITAIFILMGLNFSTSQSRTNILNRSVASKDRILSNIRMYAGMPAALRYSSIAEVPGGTAFENNQLYNCVQGPPSAPHGCINAAPVPFTLYKPSIPVDPTTGLSMGLAPITAPSIAPLTAANAALYDSFGQPCSPVSANCFLDVYTNFVPQCAPSAIPSAAPSPVTAAMFSPLPSCTVADSITVNYLIRPDPQASQFSPTLSAFVAPFVGSVTTSVISISGNSPQP